VSCAEVARARRRGRRADVPSFADRVQSNFDFQSLNLALNQELIELDLCELLSTSGWSRHRD
jgi:predicted nucleic acid-binding Zn ribbon protein